MVVADAESPGPVRKKARLSLKKGSNHVSTNTPTSIEVKEEPLVAKEVFENLTDKDHSIDGDTSIASSDSTIVPAVSSLVNLGNTCFLNSVLQVLRFTPGFLDRLDDLYQELVQAKKSKKQEIEKENDDEAEPFKIPQTCELVKFLHKHYRSMERREEKHPEVATADVMSMALKPERILNTIRELNPMFEGCLQHDAQELLRCILCYLQDAEKEVLKLKESLPPAILPQFTKQIHPIMQNFLTFGRGDKSRLPKGDNLPVLCTEKMNEDFSQNSSFSNVNLNKSDILEQIDPSETAMTGGGTENISPVKNPECQIADEPIGSTEEKEHCKKSNNLSIKRQGKRKSAKKRLENLSGVLESACNSDENGRQCEKEVLVNNFKSECQKNNQPSILTMLKGSTSCKRLGMRGAVLKTKENENSYEVDKSGMFRTSHLPCKNGGIIINNTRNGSKKGEQTDKDLVLDVSTSSDQMECDSSSKGISGTDSPKKTYTTKLQNEQSGQPTIFSDHNEIPNTNKSPVKSGLLNVKNSPVKNGLPFVKLENCDHVCNSPKKSVSAAFATKTLSPLKSNSPKSNMAASVMTKLDFSNNKLQLQSKDIIIKKDFVEKLFMGTLMLRTTCMECECSRERIEEFHDISVAVRKEKKDESDDEDEDEELGEEEEKGTSLPKLMKSFSEVERLKGDNKYFCDNCNQLTEAERSLHYNVLPDVLSVHLKRFSTVSGIFGHVSKINDHVRIPLSLPCLRHKCPQPCSRSDHRYRLYALIAHTGVTLTSGHYLAYVRVNNSSMQETHQSGSQSCSHHQPSTESPACAKNNLSAFNSQSQRALSSSPLTPQGGKLSKFVKIPTQKYEECWLECDDETVKVYSEEDFCQMLKADEGSLLGTPYVLFYHRQNI